MVETSCFNDGGSAETLEAAGGASTTTFLAFRPGERLLERDREREPFSSTARRGFLGGMFESIRMSVLDYCMIIWKVRYLQKKRWLSSLCGCVSVAGGSVSDEKVSQVATTVISLIDTNDG